MANVPAGRTGIDSGNQRSIEQVYALRRSAVDALTALAGGAQAGTPLQYGMNRFTTVASAADSAQLPAAKAGDEIIVANAAAANAMAIFPQTGEVINALAANASFSLASNKTVAFWCMVDGTWSSNLSA